jgi:hypothetical protein
MKKIILTICLVLFVSVTVFAEENSSVEVKVDLFSKYVWRGQVYNDDPVLQPSISLTSGKWTAGLWFDIDLTSYNDRAGDLYETDYALDYSDDTGIEGLGYSVGVLRYTFQGSKIPSITEIYWGLNLNTVLSPSLTFYHDVDEADGTYVQLGIGHSEDEIAKIEETPIGMETGVSIGWGSSSYNKYYFADDGSQFNDLTLSVSFPLKLCGWDVVPNLNYSTLLDDDLRSSNPCLRNDAFFTGISFSKRY